MIAASLNDLCPLSYFSNRWYKRENIERGALKECNVNFFFKNYHTHISFYSRNTNILPPKAKYLSHLLKQDIQDFHMKYVLVPVDKASNNIVVV